MAAPISPDRHIEAARRRVAHLAALDHATNAGERRIRDAAHERLAAVDADLAKLRSRALLHDGAAERMAEFTAERARLLEVIRRAEHHVGPAE